MRRKGHALAHLAQRPPWGWVWSCECGFRHPWYASTRGIAEYEHRDHQARVGTEHEHASIITFRSVQGPLVSLCSCGTALGDSLTAEDAERLHHDHQLAGRSS